MEYKIEDEPVEVDQRDEDKKSAFGPGFRKWLRMKRALRLVHEKEYPDPMYVPRIRYRVYALRFVTSLNNYWLVQKILGRQLI